MAVSRREQELQNLAMELQYYQQQAEGVQQRLAQIQNLLAEGEATLKALDGLKTTSETLMPAGSGVFSKVKIADSQKVLVEIGSRVMVEKNVADAITLVEVRGKELQKALDELNGTMEKIVERVTELDAEASKLQQQQGG